uniref:Uncharacterized protein n=1 Tax=Dulem virus 35 TaxID=3145753 RepID=A0AAU8AZG3_9CAUD
MYKQKSPGTTNTGERYTEDGARPRKPTHIVSSLGQPCKAKLLFCLAVIFIPKN